MKERDKFLTEVMGRCWHEWKEYSYYDGVETNYVDRCIKCLVVEHTMKMYNAELIDFSTWEGFGKLWEWAQKQEWWAALNRHCEGTKAMGGIPLALINPDRFADAVYNFLKGL